MRSPKYRWRDLLSLELQANPKRSGRQAILNLRATTVEILPPQSYPGRLNLQPLRVQVILAGEENPPATEKPVRGVVINYLADYWF